MRRRRDYASNGRRNKRGMWWVGQCEQLSQGCVPLPLLRLAEEEQDVLIREEIENVTSRHAHYQEPHPPDHMTYRPYSGRNTQYAWY